ncbi:MAG: cytochrome C biogenesis protein, partial [Alphaproteobacteria bacterium]|nr:cytochrome C biogenesis protein [Alphaproteobacteria bacterium]
MVRWILVLLAVLAAVPARAAESDAVRSPQAEVRLISDVDAIAPGQPFRVALYQKLATGWHTYWTNPGDAGQPPELTLSLPEGARAGELTFGAPHRLPFGPLVNFGYEGTATFTMTVTPPATLKSGDRFALSGDATWLVCERICIPEEGSFRLDLPVATSAQPSADVPLFVAAEAAQPRPSPFAARVGFEGPRGVLELSGDGIAPGAVRDAFFYPAAWGLIDHAAPQPLSVRGDHLTLTLTRGQSPLPQTIGGVIELTDAAGVRAAYTIATPPGPMPEAGSALPLWQVLAWALLGGLILNLMPCVFPILAMKAVAIAKLGGGDRAAVRAQAGGYTLGVVLSFVGLGGALAAAQTAGLAAGWGFQFTQPGFVAAMAWLMIAVGLNLSGVFAISGPVALGSGLAARGGHLGA